jgi:hypothetical protein
MPDYNLTGKYPSDTYGRLIQKGSDGLFYNGNGNRTGIGGHIIPFNVALGNSNSGDVTSGPNYNTSFEYGTIITNNLPAGKYGLNYTIFGNITSGFNESFIHLRITNPGGGTNYYTLSPYHMIHSLNTQIGKISFSVNEITSLFDIPSTQNIEIHYRLVNGYNGGNNISNMITQCRISGFFYQNL